MPNKHPTPVIAVALPKGGQGRTTTCYLLGTELARAGWRVRLEDTDPARHLTAVAARLPFPPGLPVWLDGLFPLPDSDCDIVLLDCAPEASGAALVPILSRATHVLVPVKGPEAGAISAVPLLLGWLDGLPCTLLGFLPTMFKPRRLESHVYLRELQALAAARHTRVFAPIHDLAPISQWHTPSPQYAALAQEVSDVLRPDSIAVA